MSVWEQIWPAATPRGAGLDLEFPARRIEMPGGSIRNIAVASAFMAAADGGVVTMRTCSARPTVNTRRRAGS